MILLTSEKTVKDLAPISDNVAGKYIETAIIEAQRLSLKPIIGDRLLKKIQSLIADNTIGAEANAKYKELLDDYIQFYLAYMVHSELCVRVSYKVGNLGVSRTTDDNVQSASESEVYRVSEYWRSKADGITHEMQDYLRKNAASFPELDCSANLYSAASGGIFLGGARGKRRAAR